MNNENNDSGSTTTAPQQNFSFFGKVINISLRTLMSFVGIAILSMGAALLKSSPILGLDPFTAVNTGMATLLHTSLGIYQLCANFVIFIFVLLLDRKKIGIGTIMNMVLVGFEIQWFSAIYHQIFPGHVNFLILVADLILGLLFFTAGSSLYMAPSLGVAPYDAIAPIASARLHCKYKTARVIQDICFLVAAVLVHGPVGFASIIVAFFAGPLISFWDRSISTPTMDYIDELSGHPSIKNLASGVTKATRSGYHSLSKAYNSTLDMQMHLAGYTNRELIKKIQETEHSMQESQKAYNDYRSQYRMLIAEMVKRDKRGDLKNSPVNTTSTKNNQNAGQK
ncbi:YczE/YyaS/YitT family protein [Fructilactobacillus carniphilus]|uniref:Membrane protein n=1 Tax=Fructilactobacillus carniphilus TaxID=2940297 RepID=A0ABY5BWS5_9LACO|nr:membrane protein [Fructilactobacillus carniphilus]USS90254.1 membrane protein [Fructilactobacillus carniphilus]